MIMPRTLDSLIQLIHDMNHDIGNSEKLNKEEIVKLINVLIDNDRVREIIKLNYSL